MITLGVMYSLLGSAIAETGNKTTSILAADENPCKKLVYTYQLAEHDGDLVFTMTIQNLSTKTFNMANGIVPFSVYHGSKELPQKTMAVMIGDETDKPITLKPTQSHTFQFVLNQTFYFYAGKKTYRVSYLYRILENDTNKAFDKALIRRIPFTWYQNPKSNKGHLLKGATTITE